MVQHSVDSFVLYTSKLLQYTAVCLTEGFDLFDKENMALMDKQDYELVSIYTVMC